MGDFELFRVDSFINKLLSVDITGNHHLVDDLVHEWLRERWIIKFVVTHLTVADQVNDHIFSESLAILSSKGERLAVFLQRLTEPFVHVDLNPVIAQIVQQSVVGEVLRSAGKANLRRSPAQRAHLGLLPSVLS